MESECDLYLIRNRHSELPIDVNFPKIGACFAIENGARNWGRNPNWTENKISGFRE